MATKKTSKPAAKPAAKAKPAKAPAKPAPKAAAKPAAKPVGKAPAKPAPGKAALPGKLSAMGVRSPSAKPTAGDEPGVKTPAEKLSGNTMALIEVVKDGHFFIARTETHAGTKEYKNTVFEDLLTEMLITLQEQLSD